MSDIEMEDGRLKIEHLSKLKIKLTLCNLQFEVFFNLQSEI